MNRRCPVKPKDVPALPATAAWLQIALATAGADEAMQTDITRKIDLLRRSASGRFDESRAPRGSEVVPAEDIARHVSHTGVLAGRLAVAAGYEPEFARTLSIAAPLHDIGKLVVPDVILEKPASLTEAEMAEVRRHSQVGYDLLRHSGLPLLDLAADVALGHHERWDGTGYPRGIAGEEIPLSGRIVAIVDVFDALLARRAYKEPWQPAEARAFISAQAGRQFEARLVASFLTNFDSFVITSETC